MSKLPSNKIQKIANMVKQVKICRDFYRGALEVMNKTYLPQWTREKDDAYELRLKSTLCPNIYAPIIAGIAGLVTKKEPVATGLENYSTDNVDLKGNNLQSFIKQCLESSLVAGIEFVAVVSSADGTETFFKRYKYEDFYSYLLDDGKVTQMVFKETEEVKDGLFGLKNLDKYIVFKKMGGEVWYSKDKGELKRQDQWENNLTEVPVVSIITGKELTRFEVLPRMYDIARMNSVLLNIESQLANVLSVVGNPIPVFYGDTDDDDVDNDGQGGVTIGVRDALVFKDREKEGFEYVEITGAGVSKLQDQKKDIGIKIDSLSFSLLEKSDSRTVIDAQENQAKNTSFMSDCAVELELKFNKLYNFKADLENKTLADGDGLVFKKDFDDALVSDSQLTFFRELVAQGDLSRETLWKKLLAGNILSKDFNESEENERIGKVMVRAE